MRTTPSQRLAVLATAGATVVGALTLAPSAVARTDKPTPGGHYTTKTATSRGFGGAVTSVDPEASRVGLQVLKHGGNAVDAAVATAAALGVTEPYSSGLGGGGYFVYYDAKQRKVHTIDGRETAPKAMPNDAFIDPKTKKPYTFTPDLVTSGVSVGVPGTPATWQSALDRWGSYTAKQALAPAADLADRGFVVDKTFQLQTEENKDRFQAFTTTPKLFLPGGDAPKVGSVFTNHDLAKTYRLLGREGSATFYRGAIADQVASLSQAPAQEPGHEAAGPQGLHARLRPRRLPHHRPAAHARRLPRLRRVRHGAVVLGRLHRRRDPEHHGAVPARPREDRARCCTTSSRPSALAFADRAAYLGDPGYVDVPLRDLLSDRFAAERACKISETKAFTPPVAEGDVDDYDGKCGNARSATGTKAR